MAAMLSFAMDRLHYYTVDYWNEIADPTFRFCPLLGGSPWKIISLIGIYLYFVLAAGPKMMANRKPLDIKPVIFAYNACLSVINAFFFLCALKFTNYGIRCFGCRGKFDFASDPEGEIKLKLVYLYGLTKILDLLDTVFFVLRKKQSHITVLHVYHHSLVAFGAWFCFNFGISETTALFPLCNSFVHAIMYAYYALTTLGSWIQPYLWWKRYITKLQIGHLSFMFVIGIIHIYRYPISCFPSPFYVHFAFSQGVVIISLFINFYVQRYLKNSDGPTNLGQNPTMATIASVTKITSAK